MTKILKEEFQFDEADEYMVREMLKYPGAPRTLPPVDHDALSDAMADVTMDVQEQSFKIDAVLIDDSVWALTFPENVAKIEPIVMVFGKASHHTYIHRNYLSAKLPPELYMEVMDYVSGRKAK